MQQHSDRDLTPDQYWARWGFSPEERIRYIEAGLTIPYYVPGALERARERYRELGFLEEEIDWLLYDDQLPQGTKRPIPPDSPGVADLIATRKDILKNLKDRGYNVQQSRSAIARFYDREDSVEATIRRFLLEYEAPLPEDIVQRVY